MEKIKLNLSNEVKITNVNNNNHFEIEKSENLVTNEILNRKSLKIMSHIKQVNTKSLGLSDFSTSLMSNVLFYLDLKSISNVTLVSKEICKSVKTHMILRTHYFNIIKQNVEKEYEEVIMRVMNKRDEFFQEYEIPKPNKDLALQKITKLNKDVSKINKKAFKRN